MNRFRPLPWVLILAVSIPIFALADESKPLQPALPDVELLWGVKIPMRDGVKLNATLYKPKSIKESLPVIFTLTPYISDSYHDRAMYFSQHGYVYALVDVRGRGNSEGKFEPFANEARDGDDVVEWLAKQPWSNGKVAMWGGSYAGFDQWATLKEFPPHLATIVPAAAAHAAVDFPFFANVYGTYDIQWLTFTSGVTGNDHLFGESPFWNAKFWEYYSEHQPFKDLDKTTGDLATVFQLWLQHPTPDAYWDAMAPTPDDYRRINIPILTITGDYDGDQRGALTYYRRHMQYGNDEAKAKHFLIIGPWDHAGTRTPKREVGGLIFGGDSMLDLNQLHREWYDWTMKTGAKPQFLKKRVAYYLTGAEQWKYADSFDSISNATRRLYLHSERGEANDVFHSGKLSETKPATEAPDKFTYDPLDTRPGALERKDVSNYITDETGALNLYGDGVIYHSEPFEKDTEISGYLKLVVWMSMDVPDTDFAVQVFEIMPNGTSIALTDDLMRARYRESLREAKAVKSGEVTRYEFTGFQWFSRRIMKGSRLRVLLGCPNTIHLEKNYNSGGNVAEESGKDARTAHITIYHDAERASFLDLPIVQ
ncbi:MAG TPA: CocE/NonD family hydrolase [Terriglobia bacterium]|nr:CocE/NonD family hydrolase [Terriglobia bacterium]